MGTTLVALLRSEATAVVANVGDSRVYLRRDGRTMRITEDHVYGRLVAEAASVPNLSARLARFLDGRTDGRSPDLTSWNLRPGDRFLLCSDGLTAPIPDDLIHGVLTTIDNPGQAADQLVGLAVLAGGPDNVTVVIVDVKGDS
jgi:protein phosphatase